MNFTDRINYKGNISDIVIKVVEDYRLDDLTEYSIIEIGYEDLNVRLITSTGRYLIKIFGSFRDEKNCRRYVDIMERVIAANVPQPKLFQVKGNSLYKFGDNQLLCVMEFIDGQSFYDLNERPTLEEAKFLIDAASKINSIKYTPEDFYDEWSPVNLLKEYKLKHQYLSSEDDERFQDLLTEFAKLNLESLPQTFVHGDIIRPNVLKDLKGNIYITDFSIASVKPRVQELSVLLCGMFFNEEDPSNFDEYYDLVIGEYKPELTGEEKVALPLFVKATFAMYIMQGTCSKVTKKIDNKENDYWIRLGQIGLKYFSSEYNV
jgi:Ser/Thr protein kinase RdoA (MazF antagonist)